MTRSYRRAVLVFALLASLGVGALPAHAAGIPEDECKMDPTVKGSICAYVTNRVLRFGDQPGVLAGAAVVKGDVRVIRGFHAAHGQRDIPYNDASWDKFGPRTIHGTGVTTYHGADAGLTDARVDVRADHEPFTDTDPNKRIGLTCEAQTFFVCETPPVWMKNRVGSAWYNWASGGPQPVSNVIGFATIESRPLIVKVLNMTDQPLVRSGDVRTNGLLRSTLVTDPGTVAASIDDRTGVGYYHFYRDADHSTSATFFYEFANGPTATSLTGGALEFTVNVAADGSTDASKCVPPTGLLQSVECSVTVIGIADGTLQALVAVGV
jgi:hypothetical protein